MKPRNHLHILTCFILPLTILAAWWTGAGQKDFSPAMKRRAQLGLPGGFVSVVIAVELAGSPEKLQAIFAGNADPEVDASRSDREIVNKGLFRDYFLIAGYTLLMLVLGLRTWQPGSPSRSGTRLLLILLPLLVAICDVSENIGAQTALRQYPEVSPGVLRFTATASWAKWILGFLQMIVLGRSMLGLARKPSAGAFLREFAGLILLSAGIVGLSGIMFPSIIPNTFLFGLFAVVPIGFMLFFPDQSWSCACRLSELRYKNPGERA
jgi:hypothetical protein